MSWQIKHEDSKRKHALNRNKQVTFENYLTSLDTTISLRSRSYNSTPVLQQSTSRLRATRLDSIFPPGSLEYLSFHCHAAQWKFAKLASPRRCSNGEGSDEAHRRSDYSISKGEKHVYPDGYLSVAAISISLVLDRLCSLSASRMTSEAWASQGWRATAAEVGRFSGFNCKSCSNLAENRAVRYFAYHSTGLHTSRGPMQKGLLHPPP